MQVVYELCSFLPQTSPPNLTAKPHVSSLNVPHWKRSWNGDSNSALTKFRDDLTWTLLVGWRWFDSPLSWFGFEHWGLETVSEFETEVKMIDFYTFWPEVKQIKLIVAIATAQDYPAQVNLNQVEVDYILPTAPLNKRVSVKPLQLPTLKYDTRRRRPKMTDAMQSVNLAAVPCCLNAPADWIFHTTQSRHVCAARVSRCSLASKLSRFKSSQIPPN